MNSKTSVLFVCMGNICRSPADQMNSKTSVLFVCMGNICRSPAAEAVFRHIVESVGVADQFIIDSAGTIGYHAGDRADRRMRAAGSKRGYNLDSISRRVRSSDFEEFDHIIAMDYENLQNLESMSGNGSSRARISMMCEYARQHDDREVPDPYYGGEQGFEHVMDLLEDACSGLLDSIQEKEITS